MAQLKDALITGDARIIGTTYVDDLESSGSMYGFLADGTTAVTQDSLDSSDKVATTSYVDFQTASLTQDVTTIKTSTDSITTTVGKLQQTTDDLGTRTGALETYKSTIKQTTDNIILSVSEIISGSTAVSNVQTACATLDKDGLTVSQDGKHTKTIIDAEGLTIKNTDSDEEMLEVVVEGGVSVVRAQNFESNSYIKVGYSRFEDYTDASDVEYTGVFWLGA